MNLHNAEFVRSVTSVADCPKDGLPQIAFAGKSNVGKSSVINKLLLRKNFARVGEAPGKTTHISTLAEAFARQGRTVLRTREPGGTALAEKLRHITELYGRMVTQPAPPSPTQSQQGWPSTWAQMDWNMFFTWGQASGEPPGIMLGPFSAPSSPPDTPVPI